MCIGWGVHAPRCCCIASSRFIGLVNVSTIGVRIEARIHSNEQGRILDVLVLAKESHWVMKGEAPVGSAG